MNHRPATFARNSHENSPAGPEDRTGGSIGEQRGGTSRVSLLLAAHGDCDRACRRFAPWRGRSIGASAAWYNQARRAACAAGGACHPAAPASDRPPPRIEPPARATRFAHADPERGGSTAAVAWLVRTRWPAPWALAQARFNKPLPIQTRGWRPSARALARRSQMIGARVCGRPPEIGNTHVMNPQVISL
jgi:hypothetical protein